MISPSVTSRRKKCCTQPCQNILFNLLCKKPSWFYHWKNKRPTNTAAWDLFRFHRLSPHSYLPSQTPVAWVPPYTLPFLATTGVQELLWQLIQASAAAQVQERVIEGFLEAAASVGFNDRCLSRRYKIGRHEAHVQFTWTEVVGDNAGKMDHSQREENLIPRGRSRQMWRLPEEAVKWSEL